jgi:hypothetical protein
MKNKNWIKLISESYIRLNEEMDIFDDNLWQELVAGTNQQQPKTPTTTTTKRRRVATGGASSTT